MSTCPSGRPPAWSPYSPYTSPPVRSFAATVRQPPSRDGRTHASTVIPDERSSEAESGIVTQSLTPSKLNADANRPDELHVAPDTVPLFPRPEESATVAPEPALNPYAATSPDVGGGGGGGAGTTAVASAEGGPMLPAASSAVTR